MEGDLIVNRRGRMHRIARQMSDADARAFLMDQAIAHVASVDGEGWPYVVPLIYIYEGGSELYLHTGHHQGHFESNVRLNPKTCIEVERMGPVHRGHPFACNSALVYTSVIAFGSIEIIADENRKAWFFDRVLAKYGQPDWTFTPGYPSLSRTVLYELHIETLTGKHSAGLQH